MTEDSNRYFMLSWLLLPLMLVWLSTNYLLGLKRQTTWQVTNEPNQNEGAIPNNANKILAVANEIQPIKWDGEGMVSITFDDAWLSQYAIAYPMVENLNLEASLSVPTGLLGLDGYMGWNQIRALNAAGWEILSHSHDHTCDVGKLTEEGVRQELVKSKEDLLNHGINATNYVSPCGTITSEIKNLTKEYYLSLRSTDDGLNPLPVADPYYLKIMAIEWTTTAEEVEKWLNDARDSRSWLLLVFHQIQNEESKYAVSLDNFEIFMNLVAQSGLKTVLPSQALHLDISPVSGDGLSFNY